jgi:hypothetical protein
LALTASTDLLAEHDTGSTDGPDLTRSVVVDVTSGFPESLRESGTDILGQPASVKMQVSRANTLECGMQFNF